jgi:excinuclease ABC subunit A
MFKSLRRNAIRLRGVRQNNLKNFDLDLPLGKLIVITGLSGSGKSSLAFDTLFAEGQRRYIETFSPYARQFLDRMDKPKVDAIEGIPPAVAVEQRNSVKTTRSTVGTMTEICDYMKVLWAHLARLYCRSCGQPVRKEPPQLIWDIIKSQPGFASETLITFDLPVTEKLGLDECLGLVARQGYQRLLVQGEVVRLEDLLSSGSIPAHASITVVQDRVRLVPENRARFVEACEQAYHFGKGKLAVHAVAEAQAKPSSPRLFSNRYHCAPCDRDYREPVPALFSFNHPLGACPACRGFGRVIGIDYRHALPDRTRTLAQGVVRPWLTGKSAECQDDLIRVCRQHGIPLNVRFCDLSKETQDFVIDGEPGYGTKPELEWPRAWYGVKGYFRWLEGRAYKMHVRVLLSRYRNYTPCPSCQGARFQPDALDYRLLIRQDGISAANEDGDNADRDVHLTLAQFYQLPVSAAAQYVENLRREHRSGPKGNPVKLLLDEVGSRLCYLDQVGLGYLTLDRPTRSLSGGEVERVNLTTCLGTGLVNTLFVLDEPTVGLHARDVEKLVSILLQLRDASNTVVVVEHEPAVMRAADQIVDLGPGHGATGGEVVFSGSFRRILTHRKSLTGAYLAGSKQVGEQRRRPVKAGLPKWENRSIPPAEYATELRELSAPWPGSAPVKWLRLQHATRHNLCDLSVDIPLGRLVCITGVSGSGKSTLLREVLLPALLERLGSDNRLEPAKDSDPPEGVQEEDSEENHAIGCPALTLTGTEHLAEVVLVDQSALGKTPRSNPAVYIGAFDAVREFFAGTEAARKRGLNASAFSYNSPQGQCERCRGAGFEKIEMQFLSDVFIRCADCDGRRYRRHILEVKISPAICGNIARGGHGRGRKGQLRPRALSIADLLESTVDEALEFFSGFPQSKPALAAATGLRWLQLAGLGYLQLGQPINTLSGGESQRLKLVRRLATASFTQAGPTLFLFDEPTTGLHFEDVRVLLRLFQRLVDSGHSVLVIEHQLDVIQAADWIVDMGPEGGADGGRIVVTGPPETVAACPQSHTGRALINSSGHFRASEIGAHTGTPFAGVDNPREEAKCR